MVLECLQHPDLNRSETAPTREDEGGCHDNPISRNPSPDQGGQIDGGIGQATGVDR